MARGPEPQAGAPSRDSGAQAACQGRSGEGHVPGGACQLKPLSLPRVRPEKNPMRVCNQDSGSSNTGTHTKQEKYTQILTVVSLHQGYPVEM